MSRTVRTVWVARAEPEAARTAARLTEAGFAPLVAPVLKLAALPLGEVPLHSALAFTSLNGVGLFAARTRRRDQPVFAVGDATAEAARRAGWTTVASAGGDVGALARLILSQPPRGVVLAPGARHRAGDLPRLLAGRVRLELLPLYDAVATGAPPPADFDAVLIHSPRAAEALAALPPETFSGRLAVAFSPAAAAPLAALPLAAVRVADAPNEAALFSALGKPGSPV